MSIETEIQSEVDALKVRFDDTKALYREVCALLFFRYGLTPTANKLYQFVRKGSMSAPADALTKFWDDLRSKARVEIDHPDLPPELKAIAAEAIASIWRQAAAGARAELAELRIELRAEVERAEAESNDAHEAAEASRLEVINLEQELHEAEEAGRSKNVELEAERRAHAASAARVQELQRLVDELRAEQGRQRAGFSADLAKSQDAVERANSRADDAERRAMLEIDQERQAKSRSDKQVETLKAQVGQLETQIREQEHTAATETTRQRAAVESAEQARQVLQTANEALRANAQAGIGELQTLRESVIRLSAQNATLQSMIDRFDVRPTEPAPPANRAARGPREPKAKPDPGASR